MQAATEPWWRVAFVLVAVGVAVQAASLQAAPWHELFGGMPSAAAEKQLAAAEGSRSAESRPLDLSDVLGGNTSASRAGSRRAAPRRESDEVTTAGPLLMGPVGAVMPTAAEAAVGVEKDAAVCAADAEACRLALEQLRLDRISEIDLDIRVDGVAGNDYPCECRLDGEVFVPRQFATTTFTWKAAGYCHKPLYFEQWNFERYGHSYGWAADPFISAAHFFGTLPILPYKMGVELPWECVYPVGYYRPGDCAPWTVPAFPVSVRGMAVEAATVTGLVFLLP